MCTTGRPVPRQSGHLQESSFPLWTPGLVMPRPCHKHCSFGPWERLRDQECCTLMRFWLCPCCWWAHCPWWCHTGDRRERSRLGTRESKRSAKTIRSVFERQLSRGGRKSIGIYMLYFLRSFQRTKCTTCSDPFRHQNAQTDQNSLAVKAAKYMKEISLL